MNAKLNVTRFSNEDVIATSFCEHVGVAHYHVSGKGSYDAAENATYVPGEFLVYLGNGQFTIVDDSHQTALQLSGNVNVAVGSYYYRTDEGYVRCELQAHGR